MLKKLVLVLAFLGGPAPAQDKAFSLNADVALTATGFLQHLLPRFSLKTGVRIAVVDGLADVALGADGTPVFRQGDTLWHLGDTDDPDIAAFRAWLLSDIGQRTIEAYAPDGTALFSAEVAVVQVVKAAPRDGDAVLGEAVSLTQCGRCHVVNESNKMDAIGSTPSFALMRHFADWEKRFQQFFLLRPHPAFTQVADVTAPFADNLPPPIAPIELTLDEIDAITAYVATIVPADLGAPIQSQ